MKRWILASAIGVVCLPACGDNGRPAAVIDAAQMDATMVPKDGPPDARPDAPPDAFVDTSLILNYEFEDTTTVVKDSSFRNKDGTVSDIAAWIAEGRNGRALAMIGDFPTTRYVTLPDGVLTDVDDFTISVWVKYNSFKDFARIYDFGNGPLGPANRWMFLMQNAGEGFHAASFGGSPANEHVLLSHTQIPAGVWKHIALTGSGGNRQLYIDGFPAVTVANGPTVPPKEMEPLSQTGWIGRSRFQELAHDPGIDATLDDFRIYNRVLTASQIEDLAAPQHDYSYWRFDETAGTTAKDSSLNLATGTLVQNLTWTQGRVGGALDFPGGPGSDNGPHVQLSKSPLAGCTTQVTIALWVKLHSLDTWARVFDFGTRVAPADPERFMFLTLQDDQGPDPANPGARIHGMRLAMVSPNGVFDMMTTTSPVPGDDTWHHVAVTVNDVKHVVMYVDGNVVKEQDITSGVTPGDFAATTNNWLGRSQFWFAPALDRYLNGAIDELRVSCRTYTADEIKSLATPL